MKKCPFCAEEIQDEAIKCRYCGELFGQRPSTEEKWYFKTPWLIMSFLTVGPFALFLLWKNPKLSREKKVTVTIIVSVLTVVLLTMLISAIKTILGYYQQVFEVI